MNPVRKFKNIFFDYSFLFREIRKEHVIKSILFYALFSIILLAINWILLAYNQIPANLSFLKQIPLTEELVFYMPVYYFGINIITLFVFSAFLVLTMRFVNTKTNFSGNIKIYAHASVPFLFVSWITAFNLLFVMWSGFLTAKGMAETYDQGFKKSLLAVIIAGVLTSFVMLFVLILIMQHFGISFDLERIFLTRS